MNHKGNGRKRIKMSILKNRLLEINAKEKVDLEKLLSKIRITDFAFQKAKAYARAVMDVSGESLECGGFLLASNDSFDGFVIDSYLLSEQSVTGASFAGNINKTKEALEEAKNSNKKVIGWWHSHNEMATFHSETDNYYTKQIFLSIAPYNKIALSRKTVYLAEPGLEASYFIENLGENESDKNGELCKNQRYYIRLTSKDSPTKIFDIEVEDFIPIKELKIKNIVERQFFGTSFAYSMVINALDAEPYTEIWYDDIKTSEIRKIRAKGVNIVKSSEGFSGEILGEKINNLEELYELAKREVSKKVKYNGISIGEFAEIERKRRAARKRAEAEEKARREAQELEEKRRKEEMEKEKKKEDSDGGERSEKKGLEQIIIKATLEKINAEKTKETQEPSDAYSANSTHSAGTGEKLTEKIIERAIEKSAIEPVDKLSNPKDIENKNKGIEYRNKDIENKDKNMENRNKDSEYRNKDLENKNFECKRLETRVIYNELPNESQKMQDYIEGYELHGETKKDNRKIKGILSKEGYFSEQIPGIENNCSFNPATDMGRLIEFENYEKKIKNYSKMLRKCMNDNNFLDENELEDLRKHLNDINKSYARTIKNPVIYSKEEAEKASQGIALIKNFCEEFDEYKKRNIMVLELKIAKAEREMRELDDEYKKRDMITQFFNMFKPDYKRECSKYLDEYREKLSSIKNFEIGVGDECKG